MKLADFNRLKKFMAVAGSASDGEALAALRQANALIAREGLTWERVLNRSVKVIAEVEAAPEDYRDPIAAPATPTRAAVKDAGYDVAQVDDWIDVIERRANLKGDFEVTINSIIEQHREGKHLSFKQRELLHRVASQ